LRLICVVGHIVDYSGVNLMCRDTSSYNCHNIGLFFRVEKDHERKLDSKLYMAKMNASKWMPIEWDDNTVLQHARSKSEPV
jgi:hypothetical protein